MFSLIVKRKNLKFIKSCVVKVDLLMSYNLERTLVTAKILNSYKVKSKDFDVHEYFRSCRDPKNLGKIVSLDLDEVNEKVVKEKNVEAKVDEGAQTTQEEIKRSRKKKLTNLEKMVKSESKDAETVETENNEFETTKKKNVADTKQNSQLLSLVMTNLKSKKLRQKEGKIILEGKRLIHDAITSGFQPSVIFFSQKSDLEKLCLSDNVKKCKVPYKSLQLWSDVVTSQGVVGVFNMPDLKAEKEIVGGIPLTLICDNIRESGNLGCILRVAVGVGCKKVILTKGCVDVWEPKVLRAAAGAHFSLSMVNDIHWQDIENEVGSTDKIVLADTKTESLYNAETGEEDKENKSSHLSATKSSVRNSLPQMPYDSVDYKKGNVVIVIGGETQGLSEEALLFARKRQGVRVFIPMCNNADSLNSAVALGILSYEVKRQMSAKSKTETQEDSCRDESHQSVAFSPEPIFPMV